MTCLTRILLCACCTVLSTVSIYSPAIAAADRRKQLHFFEEKIRPVLVKHCYECHSVKSETMDGDYSLDTRMGVRSAGSSGKKAIIPGNPNASQLLKALRHEDGLEMPPEEKLPQSVIADFKKWIEMGAPDPREGNPKEMRTKIIQRQTEQLWSLQKLVKPKLPNVRNKSWSEYPIDQFLLSAWEKHQLQPVEFASPEGLLRRVYFDLTGLPPSPVEVQTFTKNPTSAAYEKIVERLLTSPRFGERWGRHWLDLARYAESSGMEFNFTYPHAWPYRDYVINAFNVDKPYNQFITEQIAGDLLDAKDSKQRDEFAIATGFLAIGPKRHDASRTEYQMDLADDQIKAVSKTFLGLTTGCARCHDHKFDPIPTKDYYSLASIFRSTKTLCGTKVIKYSRYATEAIPFGENAAPLHAAYQAHLRELNAQNKQLSKANGLLSKLENNGKLKTDEANIQAIQTAKAEIVELKKQIKQLNNNAPPQPLYAMGVRTGSPTDLHIAVGGDPRTKGVKTTRGFLTAVQVDEQPTIDANSCGRLELANWLTDSSNPLVSRVMVNRIWQHLFGRGIVATPNNFGTLGKAPSHPPLLDYLASSFIEQNWSIKRMIRSIVLTRTYQLSTHRSQANELIDPENIYLWRSTPRRLEVEPLRDTILAVSGELDLKKPVGSHVTSLGQQLARNIPYENINPENRHRSVYLPIVRNYELHMMQEFDFASSSLVVGRRSETTTAKQALYLLNNKFLLSQSEATARLLLKQHPSDVESIIRSAYLRALSRVPSSAELQRVQSYLDRANKTLLKDVPDQKQRQLLALTGFIQMIFSSAEFRYLIQLQPQPSTTARRS